MKNESRTSRKDNKKESGAALATVVLVSILLLTAIIALLSAASNNTKNVTDVLSETKAYYAAESGLQATINILRGNTDTTPTDPSDNIDYKKASILSQSNYSGDPNTFARLSAWNTYNYPTTGTPDRIVIGEAANIYNPKLGAAYSIFVEDPDHTADYLTFNTSGFFLSYTGQTGTEVVNMCNKPTCSSPTIYICNANPCNNLTSPRSEIVITEAASTNLFFTNNVPTSTPPLGNFSLVQSGVPVTGEIKFRVDYKLTAPRTNTKSMWGSIKQASSTSPVLVTFLTQKYALLGSTIQLCSGTSASVGCAAFSLNLTTTSPSYISGYITPIEPYRLRVVATGYGPNGARKQLEAFIQRNFFNGVNSGAATTMLGSYTTPPGGLPFLFDAGSSNGVTYSGGNCSSPAGCVPSFGLTDPNGLNYVTTHPPGPGAGDPSQMQPPPALLDGNNVPDWQQSPDNLDSLVKQLRTTAQNSGRYFVNPTGSQDNFNVGNSSNPPGSFTTGTGITFCEGSCKIGESGGGILVVTGKLTNVGNFSFKGMIIVTGEEGWERNGGGNGQVIGNVIIAPYNRSAYIPENLSSSFLAPRYYITGGGGSDVVYSDISSSIDNTSQISDFMLGIAEK